MQVVKEIINDLSELNKGGTNIILTTHYLQEAEELCNKVAMIRDGEIILNGDMQETLKKYGTNLEGIYLKEMNINKTNEK